MGPSKYSSHRLRSEAGLSTHSLISTDRRISPKRSPLRAMHHDPTSLRSSWVEESGKTTLMVGLFAELRRRGYAVSVVKHAHASFEIDHVGRDSFKMREAGAHEVALSSPRRFAVMRELGDAPEMPFEEILGYAGSCDLVLIEGYKSEAFQRLRYAGRALHLKSRFTE